MSDPPFVFTEAARDGTPLWFRPVVPTDRAALIEGFHHLSDQSKFARFNALYEDLSADQLRFLVELDYHDHFAWGVMAGYPPYAEGAAIGRYARYTAPSSDGAVVADLGITVLDRWQGKGVGSRLVDALVLTAGASGIARFETIVLAENRGMLAVFRHMDATIGAVDQGTVEVTVDIPAVSAQLTDHPLARLLARGHDLREFVASSGP